MRLVPDSVGRFEFAVAKRQYISDTGMYEYTTIAADSIDVDSVTIANQLVGSDAINGNAVIYGLNGNKVAETKNIDVQQRLKSLPKGLYIVRSRQRTWTVRN